ncbi:putative acetyltransferase [Streptococcus pneumoniae]|nr:putative acetyltransferase [Streptococcus pneumoniae]VKE52406.1 putative acetyltransferase [Streptococcus pneumoniae]VLR12348.1 putative acetyltransferase [Streptococcus pneumoniae]VMB75211.1 putative acetyltransferase [Streptococcus pneumoniae]VOA87649.1 putative acetyltransferase [Streptococcus pneumoniae]
MARTELPDKIETERLVLRVRTVADAEDIFDYASLPEAARALIDLAFKDLGLHKIELTCFGYNLQSQ